MSASKPRKVEVISIGAGYELLYYAKPKGLGTSWILQRPQEHVYGEERALKKAIAWLKGDA